MSSWGVDRGHFVGHYSGSSDQTANSQPVSHAAHCMASAVRHDLHHSSAGVIPLLLMAARSGPAVVYPVPYFVGIPLRLVVTFRVLFGPLPAMLWARTCTL